MRATYSLTETFLKRLEAAKASLGVPYSEMVRRALDVWLKERGF